MHAKGTFVEMVLGFQKELTYNKYLGIRTNKV